MLTKPKLSKRLQSIVDFVPSAPIVADIGCDHAYVSISLILHHKAHHVYAIDNKREPLENARRNIRLFSLDQSISVHQNPLKESLQAFDGCIIAGVGKETAVSILDEFEPQLHDLSYVCIQVNAQIIDMRTTMKARGYRLIDEIVVFDKIHYVIMLYQKGEEHYDGAPLLIGPILLHYLDKNRAYLKELKQTAEHFRRVAHEPAKRLVYTLIDDYLQGIL